MSLKQHLVSPLLPTILADRANVELPGQDLVLVVIRNVHVVQTRLDVPTFKDALSKTLQIYPHIAGQLRSNNGRWFVELTNTPVPLDIEYKINATSDAFLDGDWVVQDDLSPFLSQGPISIIPVNDGDSHLVRFKLTFFTNETAIGLSWHHALGDATLVWRLMRTLSQFYQGLPPECPPPTFDKHHFPALSPSMVLEHGAHAQNTLTFQEFQQWRNNTAQDFRELRWRLDDSNITDLRTTLSSRTRNNYLSKQDCLSAFVIAALNHAGGKPMKTVLNVCSYRDMDAPFASKNVAGNMMFHVPATVPREMTGIATALRESLVRYRNPGYAYDLLSKDSDDSLRLVNAGRTTELVLCDDTSLMVNSMTEIDWCGVHFGCPDGSRFYESVLMRHLLSCFRSNPVRGDDGVWQARPSIDIAIWVRAELEPKLLETFARGFRYVLDYEGPLLTKL